MNASVTVHTPAPTGHAHIHTRKTLIKKYGKCMITGWKNPLEYQSAHIIPRAIGRRIAFPRVDDVSNCLLLANGLHGLFDGFVWTVDIFSFLDYGVQSEKTFTCTLAIRKAPAAGGSVLYPYIDKKLTLPICYLPSLYVHYYVYLHMNYGSRHPINMDTAELFNYYLSTEEYQAIKDFQRCSQFYEYFHNRRMLEDHGPQMERIIGSSGGNGDNCTILWKYWSFGHITKEPTEYVPAVLVNAYNEYLEYLNDPSYVPGTE